nr:hypothetical protein [Tessaracoccus sp. OS52]
MAFADAGLEAHGVEADPLTASFATANLALVGGPAVVQGLAEEIEVPEGAGVFLDPARRTARGRTWDVGDFTPPWSVVTGYLSGPHFTCVKLGPGLPKELIPDGVAATWVSDGGSVVEVSLWNRRPPGRSAVVSPRSGGAPIELRAPEALRELPVADVGRYLIEPDNAVVRSGLVTEIAPDHDLWLLDPHIAYLSSDEPLESPLAQCFEVTAVLPHDLKAIRTHLRDNRIGNLEIKLRGIDVDPAELRRRLKPHGPGIATLILSRTPRGAVAVMARRVT